MSMQTLLRSWDDDTHPAIPQVEQLGYAFLVPSALTALISAVETGIIITCLVCFLAHSKKERRAIKALVYIVSCIAMYISSILCTCLYYIFPHSHPRFFALSALSDQLQNRFQTAMTFAMFWRLFVLDFENGVRAHFCLRRHGLISCAPYLLFPLPTYSPDLWIACSCYSLMASEDTFLIGACCSHVFVCHLMSSPPHLDDALGRPSPDVSHMPLLECMYFIK